MIVGVPRETRTGERRVSLAPAHVAKLESVGFEVHVESGAGVSAGFDDDCYQRHGARVFGSREELFRSARVIAQVNTYGADVAGLGDLPFLSSRHTVVGFADPLSAPSRISALADRGISLLSMEMIPRITRAQSMDALSSMATIAGYKAAVIAAYELPRLFPMFMTAAGTVPPAKVLVIGAGVAGLQAIATAKRLGARVSAYDVRPAVREQVESVGATFVELDLETDGAEAGGGYAKEQKEDFLKRQRELMGNVVAASDVVITTAAIPGRRSPLIVTEDMVRRMAHGSVIVDLAAERGGNCALTQADQRIESGGVIICGPVNLPSSVPQHASTMYGKNVSTLLAHVCTDGTAELNTEDEITNGALVVHRGEVVSERIRTLIDAAGSDEESN